MAWRILGRCIEGKPFMVGGVNIWEPEWESLGPDPVEVFDHSYRDTVRLRRYMVQLPDRVLTFAAGETSANVWMFGVEE